MFFDAGILHRDISPWNIVLDDPNDIGNRGRLIDLDLAMYLADLRDGKHVKGDFGTVSRLSGSSCSCHNLITASCREHTLIVRSRSCSVL